MTKQVTETNGKLADVEAAGQTQKDLLDKRNADEA